MRILIDYVLPLLAPTLLWLLWLVWNGWRARRAGLVAPTLRSVPLSWLLAAGLVLAGTIAVGAHFRGYSSGSYLPAAIDDQGRLVPGSIR